MAAPVADELAMPLASLPPDLGFAMSALTRDLSAAQERRRAETGRRVAAAPAHVRRVLLAVGGQGLHVELLRHLAARAGLADSVAAAAHPSSRGKGR